MKIVQSDETAFEARQNGWFGRIVCALFVLMGVGILAYVLTHPGVVHEKNGWLGYLVPILFLLAGFSGVLFISDKQLRAERASRQVVLRFRSLVKRTETAISFDDVAEVVQSVRVDAQASNTRMTQMVLKSGEVVSFEEGGGVNINGIPLGLLTRRASFAEQLAMYLGVPYRQLGAAELLQLGQQLTQRLTGQATVVSAVHVAPSPVVPSPDGAGFAAIRPESPKDDSSSNIR